MTVGAKNRRPFLAGRGNRLGKAVEWLLDVDRRWKKVIVGSVDGALCIATAFVAFSLRLSTLFVVTEQALLYAAAALAFWLPLFLALGVYRAIFRYSGSRTMAALAKAVFALSLPLIVLFTFNTVAGVPRTIPIIHSLLFLVALCLSRIVARYLFVDLLAQHRFQGLQRRVMIYGAGTAGRQLASSIRHEPGMALCGFIDDDARLDGQRLDGHLVYHSAKLAEVVPAQEVDSVLLAMPSLSRAARRAVVESLEPLSVHVQTLPNLRQVVSGEVSMSDLREIQVEDLLGRDPVPPNGLLMTRTIVGKNVLVTGAGGSIGSELCRQILALGPRTLFLADSSEYSLYAIEQELSEAAEEMDEAAGLVPILCDVADPAAVARLFDHGTPDTVFHAAAYKHVPMIEANPLAGLKNNVFGTLNMALEAERRHVSRFILISTDKAVRPTNVMGASKRVAELVLQAFQARGSDTVFSMVRFGNVLGSSGSVVPRFQRQIANGGPVTLTHREVTRYFMTIPEAAQLVLQAGGMASGGEVYVLDMGSPVKIVDLARSMIRLCGLVPRDDTNPNGDIEIREVGLRPGEKLYEELLIGNDPSPTRHERIMQAHEEYIAWAELEAKLGRMRGTIDSGEAESALTLLRELVPEYRSENAGAAAAATA